MNDPVGDEYERELNQCLAAIIISISMFIAGWLVPWRGMLEWLPLA